MSVLEYEINPFNGAIIESSALPEKADQFAELLHDTIQELKKDGRMTLWITIPIEKSPLVPVAVAAGCRYHHAGENYLQLVMKISPKAFVPAYATHYIGAGGVVMDDDNRILVVQEKYHTRKHYKLPGGALDQGEHIADAVVREIFEETGIRTEFQYLSCFRHWHGYRYGKSDIYFVCKLKPLTFDIQPDPKEILEAHWMPIDQYLNDPDTHPFNQKIVRTCLKGEGLKLDRIPDYGTPETHEMMFF